MAYVILNSQFNSGLQQYSILLLESLKKISQISPFNIVDVRTEIELNQTQPFTDDAFLKFLSELYNLEIDYTLLTAAETTVLNVIREYIQPVPSLACCGSDVPDLFNTVIEYNLKIGTLTFEHETRINLTDQVTCDVFDIVVTITPQIGSPLIVGTATNTLNLIGCINNESVYSYLWIDFVTDPSGFTYDIQIELRDSSSSTIALLNTTYLF
jgi:hypothetical protein